MKELLIFLAAVSATKAISGGHDSEISRHKWQVSLRHKGNHFCGASIIDKSWGLTSASCLEKYSTDLSVRAGSSNLTASDGFQVDVKSFLKHPKYNKVTQESDLALLKFAENIEDDRVFPALLPFWENTDVPQSVGVALTGWGTTKPGGNFSEVLQMGYPSSLSRDKCQVAYPTKVISLNMFCAGVYNVQDITACDGDYGGPATISNCLNGVISWGGKCGDTKSPTVMTRLAGFKDWVLNNTGITHYIRCPNVF